MNKIVKKLKVISITSLFLSIASIQPVHASEEIDKYLIEKMKAREIPGLQVGIIKSGKIVKLKTYGYADLSHQVKANDETVFAINSITKAFVGVAVMQLVEQGKIDLKKPVGDYLEDIPENWKQVRIEQLMAHQSGLPDVMNSMAQMRSPEGWDKTWELTLKAPPEFKPGEKFGYNQTNYVLIGRIIKKLSGATFEEFITEQQFNPAGMNRTAEAGFAHYDTIISNRAQGYSSVLGDKMVHAWELFPPETRTAAGMQSTAKEVSSWLMALQGNELLSKKESLKRLWTPIKTNGGKSAGFGGSLNGYGIGWPLMNREENPVAMALGGARSVIAVYPEKGISIVILTNLQGGFPERMLDGLLAIIENSD